MRPSQPTASARQRTFEEHRVAESPGLAAPANAVRRSFDAEASRSIARRAAVSLDPAREAAIGMIRTRLLDYMAAHGAGFEFQTVDFAAWLGRSGLDPSPELLDLRVLGGLVLSMQSDGLIEHAGYRLCAAGGRSGSCHSSPRAVWRVTNAGAAAAPAAATEAAR